MKVICDWKDCKEIGAYKAPIERDNSKKFRLLCLNHIKIFNKKFYFLVIHIFKIIPIFIEYFDMLQT